MSTSFSKFIAAAFPMTSKSLLDSNLRVISTLPAIAIKNVDDLVIKSDVKLRQGSVSKTITNTKKYDFIDDDSPRVLHIASKATKVETKALVPQKILKPETPQTVLQTMLSFSEPEVTLMNSKQWATYLHMFITNEYVYIGSTKSTPFSRKRKELMAALEALQKKADIDLDKDDLLMKYIVWRKDIQVFIEKSGALHAYPDSNLWRHDTPIYYINSDKQNFNEMAPRLLYDFINDWIDMTGGQVMWPKVDGKKEELLNILDGGDRYVKLKKDELSEMVGKQHTMRMFHSWINAKHMQN